MKDSKFTVVDAGAKGRGVYAARDITAGEEVLVFRGSITAEQGIHTLQIGTGMHLDVQEPERYVNHSCDPNCGIRDRVRLVAMRDIAGGEEITFDYAMTEEFLEEMACLCGSAVCRKRIRGYSELPADIRRRYRGFVSEYLDHP